MAEAASDLIGAIYDAALDPDRWSAALERICRHLPGSMGNIFSEDVVERSANRFFSWGDAPAFTESYLMTYAPLNPLMPQGMFFPAGQVYSTADILPLSELAASRFAREWLDPQGYVDFVATNLQRSATGMVAFTVVRHRDQGPVDAGTKARMMALVPHVQRAIAIGRVLEQRRIETRTFALTLDALAAGLFFLTERHELAHANRAGRAMLEEGRIVRRLNGRVGFGPAGEEVRMAAAITQRSGGAVSGSETRGLPLGRIGGREHVAFVLPLTAGSRHDLGRSLGARLAVFVKTTQSDCEGPLALAAARFGLTGSEMRVLRALLEGQSVRAVSEHLGVEASTVRTHLHRLFEKTGTRRQAELIRLIGAFAGPLAPPSSDGCGAETELEISPRV